VARTSKKAIESLLPLSSTKSCQPIGAASKVVVEQTALNLLDDLIACWSSWDAYEDYYLNVHVPNIVRSNGAMKLNPNEKKVVRKLCPLLSHAEWQQLPALIAGVGRTS
jgi:hypothetical protein